MKRKRFPTGRVIALVAVIVAGVLIARDKGATRFRPIAPGVEFGLLRGDPHCKRGSSEIAALRIDPERVVIQVRHFTREPERAPLTLLSWLERSGALAVFNAGQFYPDLSYMGLLVSGGQIISPRLHPQFQAALVATRTDGAPVARVMDLEIESLDPESPGWQEVAQSFMLFDEGGRIRTRKSDQIANRTVIGQDRLGRLVVLTTKGAYTLYDFADLLMSLPLDLSHAMSMDGGKEAGLCVKAERFRYASFGRWDDRGHDHAPGASVVLPAVITVTAR